jgi:tRNA (uracil-5-)-methyltransferase TRM9
MNQKTASKLLEINRKFYEDFGKAFAKTRLRLQPGVKRIVGELPAIGKWLDIGCGNGTLAAAMASGGKSGLYVGIDFSPALLDEALKSTADLKESQLSMRFYLFDLGQENWVDVLNEKLVKDGLMEAGEKFSNILAFAVLHHIPGAENREKILRQARGFLPVDGLFVHSEWQLDKSRRLMARRLPWDTIGLESDAVEEGDTLIDWRYALPGQEERVGIRYVHVFSTKELSDLAGRSGFAIDEEFESDGKGGKLGLYQKWRVV